MPARYLLDASAAVVQRIPCQVYDVERIHHGNRVGKLIGRGAFEAGEPVYGHDLNPVPPCLWAGLQPCVEDLL